MNDLEMEIRDLLRQAQGTQGPAKKALLQQAMDLLRGIDDDQLGFSVRMSLISSSAFDQGDIDAELTAFAWCLARFDANPELFERDLYALLWRYKWMPYAMVSTPIFSRAQIEAVFDDMFERCQRAGLGLHGPMNVRFGTLFIQGRFDEAEQLRRELRATPRDSLSDCPTCVAASEAHFLLEVGRPNEGREIIDQMLANRAFCRDEPAGVMALSLLPSLEAGDDDTARERHISGYAKSRNRPTHGMAIGLHLAYCTVTGQLERALELVERHLTWLMTDPLNAAGQLSLLRGIALSLQAVSEAGHGDTPIRTSDDATLVPLLGEHEGRWTAAELATRGWQIADDLGAEFDARNGNDVTSQRNARMKSLVSVRYPVTLN